MNLLITTMIVYVAAAMMACWGLNLQFGETGVLNFAYIIFVAAGAYTAALFTLGPAHGFQHYFFGARLPFPVPWLIAALVGGALSLVVGLVGLRRLRGDYQAMVMLVVSLMATYLVSASPSFLNGSTGLALIPAPFASSLHLSQSDYHWFYALLALVALGLVFVVVRRVTSSPLGRTLRAVRENEEAAAALGKNVVGMRLLVFVLGGAIGALAGAIEVQLIGAWAPKGWTYPETFALFAAVIVGGRGNTFGVALGAILVPGLFLEGVIFLPQFLGASAIGALQWICMGLLILIFMYWRPQGVIPERKRQFLRPTTWTAGPELGMNLDEAKVLRP
ncbi:MAG: branched-chain amino acid ABC transporter permease [Acidimicrobiales bacterium]